MRRRLTIAGRVKQPWIRETAARGTPPPQYRTDLPGSYQFSRDIRACRQAISGRSICFWVW
jgi:hypothetical protein